MSSLKQVNTGYASFCYYAYALLIAAAWSISEGTVNYLSIIIEEHHSLFKNLYPDKSITPKMHYMIHYASQIRKFGPLINSWTMRYESKLHVLKRASRHGNFKKICWTVAKRHQHMLCYYLNSRPKDIEIGPIEKMTTLASETDFYKYISETLLVSLEDVVEHPKYIKYNILHIRKGVCVYLSIGTLYPIFGRVEVLISCQSCYFLKLQECETECFHSHFNSFVVTFKPSFTFIPLHSLPAYPVLHIHKPCSTTNHLCFLTLKQFIEII